MEDRFERTSREAVEAIERARLRQAAVRDRRLELQRRIAELRDPQPPHRLASERLHLAAARRRFAEAEASAERAHARAAEAHARLGAG
jgi:hypothetical protein